LGKKRLKVQLKRLQDDCNDEEYWEERHDSESRSKGSSADNAANSPVPHINLLKSTSSVSDEETTQPLDAIEKEPAEFNQEESADKNNYRKNVSNFDRTNHLKAKINVILTKQTLQSRA
jgi:hypothetical protein